MERLPDDIPGREILLEAGFVNYAVVKCHRSFESIRGMDPDTAQELKEYLGLEEASKPTSSNTKAEIKDYLDEEGIDYSESMLKDELLDLV